MICRVKRGISGLRGKANRRLCGVAQERHRLLQVQLHGVGVVSEVTDRHVGGQLQVEVAAAGSQHESAVNRGRPDDVAVDQPAQMFADRIAVFGGLADLGVHLADSSTE